MTSCTLKKQKKKTQDEFTKIIYIHTQNTKIDALIKLPSIKKKIYDKNFKYFKDFSKQQKKLDSFLKKKFKIQKMELKMKELKRN